MQTIEQLHEDKAQAVEDSYMLQQQLDATLEQLDSVSAQLDVFEYDAFAGLNEAGIWQNSFYLAEDTSKHVCTVSTATSSSAALCLSPV